MKVVGLGLDHEAEFLGLECNSLALALALVYSFALEFQGQYDKAKDLWKRKFLELEKIEMILKAKIWKFIATKIYCFDFYRTACNADAV